MLCTLCRYYLLCCIKILKMYRVKSEISEYKIYAHGSRFRKKILLRRFILNNNCLLIKIGLCFCHFLWSSLEDFQAMNLTPKKEFLFLLATWHLCLIDIKGDHKFFEIACQFYMALFWTMIGWIALVWTLLIRRELFFWCLKKSIIRGSGICLSSNFLLHCDTYANWKELLMEKLKSARLELLQLLNLFRSDYNLL